MNMNLPAGLERRIAYGKIVQARNKKKYSIQNISVQNINLPERVQEYSYDLPERYAEYDEYYSYEFLVNLPNVSKGIIDNALIKYSMVYIYYESDNENDACAICQESFQKYDISRLLFCLHSFHLKCIDQWFVHDNTCPLCKKELPKNESLQL